MNKSEINDAVNKVKEVVNGVSNNDIILALHSFDFNVEKTIQAFCEGAIKYYFVIFLLQTVHPEFWTIGCALLGRRRKTRIRKRSLRALSLFSLPQPKLLLLLQ